MKHYPVDMSVVYPALHCLQIVSEKQSLQFGIKHEEHVPLSVTINPILQSKHVLAE